MRKNGSGALPDPQGDTLGCECFKTNGKERTMGIRKNVKKALALVLAFQMLVGNSVPAFAEDVKDVEVHGLETGQEEADPLYLKDIEWVKGVSGTQDTIIKIDKNAGNKTLTLWNGTEAVEYPSGFGVNAPSEIVYDISNLRYEKFCVLAGVDFNARNTNPDAGSCNFVIKIDGETVYDSGLMRPDTVAEEIEVDLPEGAKELTMVVTDGKLAGKNTDWGNWIEPRLEGNLSKETDFVDFSASVESTQMKVGETMQIQTEGVRRNGEKM